MKLYRTSHLPPATFVKNKETVTSEGAKQLSKAICSGHLPTLSFPQNVRIFLKNIRNFLPLLTNFSYIIWIVNQLIKKNKYSFSARFHLLQTRRNTMLQTLWSPKMIIHEL